MDLGSLHAFVRTVQLGSITAAARALARTQPAVSVQLRSLEREVGDRLLVREPRGVRPTKTGELLYARAQSLLREAEDLLDDVRGAGSLSRGRLRIGATDVMALHLLPRILARFRKRYPGIQIAVDVEGTRGLARRVLSGDLDLALVTLPVDHHDLRVEEIHREPVVFVAGPDDALARKRRIDLRELSQAPMIHHDRNSVTREEVGAFFRTQGLEPRVVMEMSSPEVIKELVSLGLGIAPLSRSQVAGEIRAGKLVRLKAPEFRCWRVSGLVLRRDAQPVRAAQALMKLLPKPAASASG